MAEKDNVARKSAEYTGRSVDDAVAAAALELGVSVSELNYRVVKNTSHSFLGLVRTGEVTIVVDLGQHVQDQMLGESFSASTEDLSEDWDSRASDDVSDDASEGEYDEDDVVAGRGPDPELEAIATEVLATLLDKMGYYAAVEVQIARDEDDDEDEDRPLRLNIVGDDVTSLIGRRGETLRDLQFVARLIVSRQLGGWPNIVLDVEGYKERRAHSLRTLALHMAEQVRETGEPVTLEPMPSYERRIVHLTLRDAEDVYTESIGQDESRKVQILPK